MEGLFVVFSSFPSYYEFGATELNSTFETTAVSCRPSARSNLFEFGTTVARRLEQA